MLVIPVLPGDVVSDNIIFQSSISYTFLSHTLKVYSFISFVLGQNWNSLRIYLEPEQKPALYTARKNLIFLGGADVSRV